MARGSRQTRASAKEETLTLTPAQVKRLEAEIVKFPSPSPYYKKKIATSLAKEMKISDKIITNWINQKFPKETKAAVVIKKETPTPVKTPTKTASMKPQPTGKNSSEEEIEIIDIDDDDDDDKLLNESPSNSLLSLAESSTANQKVDQPKEDPKTFVRTVKLKSKTAGTVASNKSEVDTLKQQISELQSINREAEARVKKKYEGLMADMETRFRPIMETYKTELNKKDTEISKLKESQGGKEKELRKQLKEREQKVSLLEKKLTATEDEQRKREEERLQTEKTLRDIKNSQILLSEKHKEELSKKEEELEKVNKKSMKMKEKFEKDLEAKEKELKLEAKEVQKLAKVSENKSKVEEEKKILTKKISKLEAECLQKNKSIDALKQKVTSIENQSKSKTDDLGKAHKDLELAKKENVELRDVLLLKNDAIKELQQKEENFHGKSEKELFEARAKLNETKNKLQEKNCALKKELDDKTKALIALRKDCDNKTEELSMKMKIISQCKVDLEQAKNVITETKNDIPKKDEMISELKVIIDEKNQEISQLQNKVEAKDLEMKVKERELEEISKKLDDSKDLKEKIKEKQLNILKLNNTVYEKDSLIAKKNEEVKKLSSRILDLHRENERTLESRSFQEINNLNKLRHELLSQQQEMRKCYEAEIEAIKLVIDQEKLKAERLVEEARAEMRLAAGEERVLLLHKLAEKRRLVLKVKSVLLYKPAEVRARERGAGTEAVTLRLGYNWPLLHLSGLSEGAAQVFYPTEALRTLLEVRPMFTIQRLPMLLRQGVKRKAQSDTAPSKRIRLEDVCWPVAIYQPSSLKRKLEQLEDQLRARPSKKLRSETPVGIIVNIPLAALALNNPLTPLRLPHQQRPVRTPAMLMLTYEQPPSDPHTEDDGDIGLIDIQCYNYKVVSPTVRSKVTGLISRSEKVTPRRYSKPTYTEYTARGRKRSFLEFLETLSHEEMVELSAEMTDVSSSLLQQRVKFSPPSKRSRYSRGLTARTFPSNLEPDAFYFDFDEAHSTCQIIIKKLIDSVFH